MITASHPITEVFDPLSYDPYNPFQDELLPRVRREAPVFFDGRYNMYFVMTYEPLRHVLGDWQTYSSDGFMQFPAVLPALAEQLPNGYPQAFPPREDPLSQGKSIFTQAPPGHTRIRRVAQSGFLPKTLRAMQPDFQVFVDELIDAFIDSGSVDIVREFCEPLPIKVMSRLLGLPMDDYEAVRQFSEDTFSLATYHAKGQVSDEEIIEMSQSTVAWDALIREVIEQRAADPREDLISMLVHADDGSGGRLATWEVVGIVASLLFAGTETNVGVLGNVFRSMAEEPEQWRRIDADRTLVPSTIDELLRHRMPARGGLRNTTCDTELAGVDIPAGSLIYCHLYSANRDESYFGDDAEQFDVDRPTAKEHLSFGYRTHFCLGAPLVRVMVPTAIERVLDRMPNIRYPQDAKPFRYLVTDPITTRTDSFIVEWDRP